jgi:hypothetical protein
MELGSLVHSEPDDGKWSEVKQDSPGGCSGECHPDDVGQLPLRPGSSANSPGSARVVDSGA